MAVVGFVGIGVYACGDEQEIAGPEPAATSVSEPIAVSDSVTVTLGPVPVVVTPSGEVVTVSDSVTVELGPAPAASQLTEGIAISDSVAVALGPPPVAVTPPDEIVTVSDSVTVTLGPPPAEAFVYVTNEGVDSVAVLDQATHTIEHGIAVGSGPWAMAVRPGGEELYVVNRDDNDTPGSVSVIDLATDSVVATIPDVGEDPFDIEFSSDGSTAYVADNNIGQTVIIDAVTRTVVGSLDGSGTSASSVLLDASGGTAYVVSDDTLVVFDTESMSATDTLAGTWSDLDAALTPDGSEVLISDFLRDRVVFVDPGTLTVDTAVSGIGRAAGIDLTPHGTTAWVVSLDGPSLVPIDIATRAVGTPIGLPFEPFSGYVTITPDGTTAYVPEGRFGYRLAVVDLATGTVETVPVGGGSWVDPAHVELTP